MCIQSITKDATQFNDTVLSIQANYLTDQMKGQTYRSEEELFKSTLHSNRSCSILSYVWVMLAVYTEAGIRQVGVMQAKAFLISGQT